MQPHLSEPIALLVDDDRTRRAGLSAHLGALGVSSVGVPHVLPALSCLAGTDSIRLVLIDEDVAEETGLRTLVQAARSNGRRARTVLLLSDIACPEKYRASGVECYIRRPMDVRGAGALLQLAQHRDDACRELALTG